MEGWTLMSRLRIQFAINARMVGLGHVWEPGFNHITSQPLLYLVFFFILVLVCFLVQGKFPDLKGEFSYPIRQPFCYIPSKPASVCIPKRNYTSSIIYCVNAQHQQVEEK